LVMVRLLFLNNKPDIYTPKS